MRSLQLVHQESALEGSGQRLPGTAQEAQVLGEVALPRVVDVEQPEELVVDDQRQADLARRSRSRGTCVRSSWLSCGSSGLEMTRI